MKRDMKLVDNLLELIESTEFRSELEIPKEWNRNDVAYHLKILDQAGYTESNVKYASNNPMWIYSTLTWEGQEYLHMIRNDETVKNAEEKAESKGSKLSELPFEVMKALLVEGSKQAFGLK
jgi:Hypothetical protein (DUF2513)